MGEMRRGVTKAECDERDKRRVRMNGREHNIHIYIRICI
jgi:hypothetical protein